MKSRADTFLADTSFAGSSTANASWADAFRACAPVANRPFGHATWTRAARRGLPCGLPQRAVALAVTACAAWASGAAQAQTAAAPGSAASGAAVSEFAPVVITSRKRAETLTQTPAAVSAFTADDIAERNLTTLNDIGKYVPNMDISQFGAGNPAHSAIFIRGIGLQDHIITTDPGVGLYLDGVYLGRQMGANLGLSNIQRVEVLRGPQGTLYGKNTSAAPSTSSPCSRVRRKSTRST